MFARGTQASQLFYDLDRQNDCVTTDAMPQFVQALLGKGSAHQSVALMQGEEFVARKKEVLGAFSNAALEKYWASVMEVMEKYVESWVKRKMVCMAKELDDLAFEISARCFIGATDPSHVHKLRTIAGGASVLDVAGDPAVASAIRDALIEEIDEEMEAEMQMGDVEDHIALDFLLKGGMDVEEIKIELAHFLLKGRDSLGRLLKCFAVALCQHPNVRDEVEKEVAKVASEASPSHDVHGNMVYTGKVIKEVKRLNPLGPLAWRVVAEDIKLGETQVMAGTRVVLASTVTNQDGNQYEDPEKFDCDRFGKDRGEDKKNNGWCYVPHGTGVVGKVHRCPAEAFTAQVLKAFAIVMTNKCNWKAVEGQDFSLDDCCSPKDLLQMEINSK